MQNNTQKTLDQHAKPEPTQKQIQKQRNLLAQEQHTT
jgi:hypothetical protein